jgi:hypothetical protein
MYLSGADLIDMTVKQPEMLEEIPACARARDTATERTIATARLCQRR